MAKEAVRTSAEMEIAQTAWSLMIEMLDELKSKLPDINEDRDTPIWLRQRMQTIMHDHRLHHGAISDPIKDETDINYGALARETVAALRSYTPQQDIPPSTKYQISRRGVVFTHIPNSFQGLTLHPDEIAQFILRYDLVNGTQKTQPPTKISRLRVHAGRWAILNSPLVHPIWSAQK